jgi:hypothetical protein
MDPQQVVQGDTPSTVEITRGGPITWQQVPQMPFDWIFDSGSILVRYEVSFRNGVVLGMSYRNLLKLFALRNIPVPAEVHTGREEHITKWKDDRDEMRIDVEQEEECLVCSYA